MSHPASVKATVYGHVQGVFFRAFVAERADELGVVGYVRNMPDGSVEVTAEGEREKLERLIAYLNIGPATARVKDVLTEWSESTGKYSDFRISY